MILNTTTLFFQQMDLLEKQLCDAANLLQSTNPDDFDNILTDGLLSVISIIIYFV